MTDTNTEMLKSFSEKLIKNNIKAYVLDVYDTYWFCDILFVGEEKIEFIPFKGKGMGEKIILFWEKVKDVREYRESEK